VTRFLPCLFAVVVAVVTAVTSSSCTLLWLFNNDPAGLPCDFTSSQEGACLEGYTCVEQANQEFICVAQGALGVGDVCIASDQCDEDLTCDTLYGTLCAGDGADDPICSLVADVEKERACRQICDIESPSGCPDNTLCVDGEPDYCQAGVCTTDTDCELVAGQGALCSGETLNEGKSGLCFEACNPLACNAQDGLCNDCTGVDGAPDGKGCVPVPDESLGLRNVCDFPGVLANFADCSSGERCGAGAFCFVIGIGDLRCTPWCNASGGSPECPTNSECQRIVVGNDLGHCLPNF
jgi:hypothetical protein